MNTTEHLLVCVAEEASELAQACSKALRFGLEDVCPTPTGGETNRQRIIQEFSELVAVIDMLMNNATKNDESWKMPTVSVAEAKKEKIIKWMKYAREKGTLKP